MTDVDRIVAFLTARLDEIEAAAHDMAAVYPPPWDMSDRGWVAYVKADAPNFLEVVRIEQEQARGVEWLGDVVRHIALHDPAAVLADVAAKRRIVEAARHTLFPDPLRQGDYWRGAREVAEANLMSLAMPFAGHPDYDQAWAP